MTTPSTLKNSCETGAEAILRRSPRGVLHVGREVTENMAASCAKLLRPLLPLAKLVMRDFDDGLRARGILPPRDDQPRRLGERQRREDHRMQRRENRRRRPDRQRERDDRRERECGLPAQRPQRFAKVRLAIHARSPISDRTSGSRVTALSERDRGIDSACAMHRGMGPQACRGDIRCYYHKRVADDRHQKAYPSWTRRLSSLQTREQFGNSSGQTKRRTRR